MSLKGVFPLDKFVPKMKKLSEAIKGPDRHQTRLKCKVSYKI